MIRTLALVVVSAALALPGAALAQERKAGASGTSGGTETVADRPILPTGDLKALMEKRDSWGTEPSMTSAEATGEQPGTKTKKN